MKLSSSGRRLAVAGSIAVSVSAMGALAMTAMGSAQASGGPVPDRAFLAAEEMPSYEGGWLAGRPADGLPENPVFCFEEELPAEGSRHRAFSTELDTSGVQVIVQTSDEDAAIELAEALTAAAADCAADWLRENPGSAAAWDDYGTVDGGDSGHVFGVHTAPPDAGTDVRLLGIGRDGSRVTLVDWGRMGTLTDAPVTDFQATLGTALDKLGR